MATTFPPENIAFLTVCKKAYVPLVDDNDESPIMNIGALRLGLMARLKEDASDDARAEMLWGKATRLLQVEEANEVGAGAEGVVQVEDTYAMSEFATELDGGIGSGWPWP